MWSIFSRFDTIPECDRQTDRHTHRHTETRRRHIPRGKKATKNAKIGVVWRVRGHPRSSETSHMTSYSTLIKTMHLSCTVFELCCIFRRKWPILTHPTCICHRRRGWSHSNFVVIFGVGQEALLWQRDCATRLPVEILQLLNIPIIWNYLRDPTFSHFYTIPECDTHTHTETDGQIHDDGMYCVSIASRGKNRPYCTRPTKCNYYVGNQRRLIADC